MYNNCYSLARVWAACGNYYDFIRRDGLSLAIWFDIVQSAFGENINTTVKSFAYVHQLMFSVLKLVL